jgi:hypothetical protein
MRILRLQVTTLLFLSLLGLGVECRAYFIVVEHPIVCIQSFLRLLLRFY